MSCPQTVQETEKPTNGYVAWTLVFHFSTEVKKRPVDADLLRRGDLSSL